MKDDDPYLYPGTRVLRNKLDIRDEAELEMVERAYVTQRIAQGAPPGDFDLAHLQAIHRHLFQDIYDWAGQLRRVDMGKGGAAFMPARFIENGIRDVHRRVVESDYLRGLSAVDFATQAGAIIGDVDHAHPFRDGNGRTQFQYLSSLRRRPDTRWTFDGLSRKRGSKHRGRPTEGSTN